jgi:hypothetical protein
MGHYKPLIASEGNQFRYSYFPFFRLGFVLVQAFSASLSLSYSLFTLFDPGRS